MPNKTMEQLSVELLQYLAERGNTTIARNNYRYILNPMTEYCKQNNNGYYSKECIERFLADHYGLQVERFETLRSHESHYHSKLRRICRMLEDLNQNRIPASRYPTSGIQLQTEAFVDILEKYRNHYQNYGYSPSSVNNYLQTARTFLEYCVEKEILHFSDTKAMHLCQAGVDMIYIRDILGHVSLETTNIYAKINIEQMRDALENAYPELSGTDLPNWTEDNSLMDFLTGL